MSVRKDIYNATAAKLEELNIYKLIDLYKGQLTEGRADLPAAFISIGRIAYEDMTMNVQQGKVVIDLYLFFDKGGETFVGAVDKDESLKVFDSLDTTINAVQWLMGDSFTEINQIGEEDLTPHYKQPAYKLSFSTLVYPRLKKFSYIKTKRPDITANKLC